MNEGTVEKIGARLIRRTGWTTDARRCPTHAAELELCFDETDYRSWGHDLPTPFDHDDNRVRWRCSHCQGSFIENYFLRQPPPTRPRERLSLSCPHCSGRRVTHDCVAACCGLHHCIDCSTELELFVDVLELEARPPEPPEALPPLRYVVTGIHEVVPGLRSGWTRPFRRCPKHGGALELVFVARHEDDDEPPDLLAWHCGDCRISWTEPQFRHWRLDFERDASPGAACPHCKEESMVMSNLDAEPDIAFCKACGSKLRLRLELRGGK